MNRFRLVGGLRRIKSRGRALWVASNSDDGRKRRIQGTVELLIVVKADGTVRVMHPEFGMGIEFASRTAEQREAVGNFIDFLTSRPGTCPELLVTPRALTAREDHDHSKVPITYGTEDSLLSLLRNHESLTQEQFLEELRKQRTSEQLTSS